MRRMRMLLSAVSLVSLVLQPSSGHADPTGCTLAGDNGTFKVAQITTPTSGTNLGFSYQIGGPIQASYDDSNAWTATGVFILSGRGAPLAYGVLAAGPGTPHTVVSLPGAGNIDEPTPDTYVSGYPHGGILAFNPGALPGGRTFDIVAYGWGGRTGLDSAVIPGSWSTTINAAGLPCTPLDVQGKLFNFTQDDFKGGPQVYTPYAGYGSNLSLTVNNPVWAELGSAYVDAAALGTKPADIGAMDLQYSNDHLGSTTGKPTGLITFGTGPQTFKANYYGVSPLIELNWVQVDLPPVT